MSKMSIASVGYSAFWSCLLVLLLLCSLACNDLRVHPRSVVESFSISTTAATSSRNRLVSPLPPFKQSHRFLVVSDAAPNEETPTTDDMINQEKGQQNTIPSSQLLPREPDSPDRALSIVSELKSNAALFAAFAYGGLSIPSTLTVNESRVTSVTTSLSITRPLPGNELVQAFVVLDTVTLCLMISCVAASQLLIYRLTDGSWYDYLDEKRDSIDDGIMQAATTTPDTTSATFSAMGRLVSDYGLEFTVARTTFDMGLVSLLLAVAVRTIAIFDASISIPIVLLLGGTCIMLATAYLQSYIKVIQRLEETTKSEKRKQIVDDPSASDYALIFIPSFIALSAILTVLFSSPLLDDNQVATKPTTTEIVTPKSSSPSFLERFRSYSTIAAETKLQYTVNKVTEEKTTKATSKEMTGGKRGSPKSREATSGDGQQRTKASSFINPTSKDDKEIKRSRKKKADDDISKTMARDKSVQKPKPGVDKTGSREDTEEKKPEEKQSTSTEEKQSTE